MKQYACLWCECQCEYESRTSRRWFELDGKITKKKMLRVSVVYASYAVAAVPMSIMIMFGDLTRIEWESEFKREHAHWKRGNRMELHVEAKSDQKIYIFLKSNWYAIIWRLFRTHTHTRHVPWTSNEQKKIVIISNQTKRKRERWYGVKWVRWLHRWNQQKKRHEKKRIITMNIRLGILFLYSFFFSLSLEIWNSTLCT